MTKISLRKHYLPDITLCWNTFVCECKCGYSLSFPVTITALNDKVFVGYLMVAKDEGTGADLGSFSIISGGKVMCGTTVRTSSWQFQICIYAEGIITSENACFMIMVSIKKMSASILKLPTIIITISHVYIFFHVVPDLGRYIRVNTGSYVLATRIQCKFKYLNVLKRVKRTLGVKQDWDIDRYLGNETR